METGGGRPTEVYLRNAAKPAYVCMSVFLPSLKLAGYLVLFLCMPCVFNTDY